MNKVCNQIQDEYRKEREKVCYNMMDIEAYFKKTANEGLIWILKDMKDTCELEQILIEHYLKKYRTYQIYDNLDSSFSFRSSNKPSVEISTQTSEKPTSIQQPRKEHNHLKVKNVKQFHGYIKAKKLNYKIIALLKNYPKYEGNIIDQLGRSSESIKNSISLAEQYYIREKFKNYSDAIGSAKETAAWLQISLEQKYITQEQYDDLDELVIQVVSILTKTLCRIKNNEGQGMNLPNPYTPNVKKFGAYQMGMDLVRRIYEITRQPEFWQERNLLYDLRKCATSCVANIAEAHQLYIPKTFRFFNDALKALSSLESRLETSLTKKMISQETFEELIKLSEPIRKVLLRRLKNISEKRTMRVDLRKY